MTELALPGICDEWENAVVEEHDGKNQQPVSQRQKPHILNPLCKHRKPHISLRTTYSRGFKRVQKWALPKARTTLRDSSWMAPSRPSCFIPTLSKTLTMMADTKPRTHSSAPTQPTVSCHVEWEDFFFLCMCVCELYTLGSTYHPKVSTPCHIWLQTSQWGRSSGLNPGEKRPESDRKPKPAPSL